MPYSTAMFS